MKFRSACFSGMLLMSQVAGAVVVGSGGPNNSAPVGQPYFSNVGIVNGASGIYLEGGWVLTANHVASSLPATATFGGVSYPTVPGSFKRLENEGPLSTFTDIVLFQLAVSPILPTLQISSSTPGQGSAVMMVGNGVIQEAALTYWDRTVVSGANNDTWVESTEPQSNISGFETTGAREIRWGENVVQSNNSVANVGTELEPIDVVSFATRFDEGALAEEAQAVEGDSGGAALLFNGSSWELAGMMFAVQNFENQPGGNATAVFGNQTMIADLSYYRDQIYETVPEPAAGALAALGALAFLRRRR